jgi:hypothetical protein
MIKIRMSLRERVAAGLVTSQDAGRYAWYLTRHAARYIRDARPYRAGARIPPKTGATSYSSTPQRNNPQAPA